MPFLPSLSENMQPLVVSTDGQPYGDGDLSIGERDRIAAHVPALNAAMFCAGAHRVHTEASGGAGMTKGRGVC